MHIHTMNHLSAPKSPRPSLPRTPNTILQQFSNRTYATTPPSRTSTYYKSFGSPMLKCFLGALFTYQLAYYGWMKLEAVEAAYEERREIAGLQRELRDAVTQQQQQQQVGKLGEVVGEVRDKVVEGVKGTEVVGRVGKGGWWPW
ncbi:hypothetical protein J1614_011978 [Plenodomus biglobosus]|nr:hypothetical protein J1614_011978 [Plenodomus biglobosus]